MNPPTLCAWQAAREAAGEPVRDTSRSPSRGSPRSAAVLALPERRQHATSIRGHARVFVDPRSLALLERIQRIAPSDANLLITGETGTGKELIARHAHALSQRHDRPFVAVNCGAFSETLVESELFGHEKGAFTGAFSAKPGWFEAADGGTLFLDEIGDLPLSTQVKLLRVLQEREIVRLGARTSISIDVRIVAATNVNLADAVAAGHFREDLFYRLNVVQVAIPRLRERPADILPLARHFIEDYRARLGHGLRGIDAGAERKLLAHAWPGNIRELENVIHHALLVSRGEMLVADDLPIGGFGAAAPVVPAAADVPDPTGGGAQQQAAQHAFESALRTLFEGEHAGLFEHIEDTVMRVAFESCRRNQIQAARLLGISRNVLRARLIRAGGIPPRKKGAV